MIHTLHYWIFGGGMPAAAAIAAAPPRPTAWMAANRRMTMGIILVAALATALGVAVYRSDPSGSASPFAAHSVGKGLSSIGNSVAALFEARSPGERASGALVNLKHRRQPIYERALPKIRRSLPGRPVASAAPKSAAPEVPPPVPPLYNIVNGPAEGAPGTIASSSAPPLGVIPGGGGFVIGSPGGSGVPGTPGIPGAPGTTGTPGTPGVPGIPGIPGTPSPPGTPFTPQVPGVPEPASWAMMLVGFVLAARSIAARPEAFGCAPEIA